MCTCSTATTSYKSFSHVFSHGLSSDEIGLSTTIEGFHPAFIAARRPRRCLGQDVRISVARRR